MKMDDPIVEEVHSVRQSILSNVGSFEELVKLLQQKEALSADQIVTGKPLAPVVVQEAA